MVFQNKDLTYYMTVERMGILTLRVSMGYMDVKNAIWELTFDI